MQNNELQIFDYENNKVRTIMRNGEVWFVLKDVCEILGIRKYRDVVERLEVDEREPILVDTLGGKQEMITINESGLYNVVLLSRKPTAKQFRKWITHEVLPSIRKHGAYVTAEKMEELMSNPEMWIKLIQTIQQERREKSILQKQIDKDKPKVIFADAVAVSDSDILVGELAKILKGNGVEVGQNRLFERLRQDGFLVRRNGSDYNMPSQKAMDLKLFKVKETAVTHSDGHVTISKTAKVTGKGQQYFINYFLDDKKDGVRLKEEKEKPFLNTRKSNGGK